jgi:hypothetical protein
VRKLGQMLIAAKAAGQIKEGGCGSNQYKRATVEPNDSCKITLDELGLSRDLSSHAQQIANIPDDELNVHNRQSIVSQREQCFKTHLHLGYVGFVGEVVGTGSI